jgi:hypothetical protein
MSQPSLRPWTVQFTGSLMQGRERRLIEGVDLPRQQALFGGEHALIAAAAAEIGRHSGVAVGIA